MLHIGCSGWSYDEWKGVLYPKGYVDKLKYYSAHYNTVEINSTFYSAPSEAMVNGWIEKVKNRRSFLFSVKLPRDLSHDLVLRDPVKSATYLDAFQSMVLYPIRKAGRLGCVLLQLPPFFTMKHLGNLVQMLETSETEGYGFFVEFRNSDFYCNDDVRKKLESAGVGVVDIDSPETSLDRIGSGLDTAYVRLHGHNNSEWKNPTSGKMERYDYLYSKDEVAGLSSVIRGKMEAYSDLFIYFNNHPGGKAARNAVDLMVSLDADVRTEQKFLD